MTLVPCNELRTMTEGQTITFFAADATPLVGTMFEPAGPARSAVLIAGGLGIPQRFYAPLGTWLARRGHRAMSFDLRGMGASRLGQYQRSLRGLDADMLTWARLDFAAAVRDLHVATAILFSGGGALARVLESLVPSGLPWGGFITVTGSVEPGYSRQG